MTDYSTIDDLLNSAGGSHGEITERNLKIIAKRQKDPDITTDFVKDRALSLGYTILVEEQEEAQPVVYEDVYNDEYKEGYSTSLDAVIFHEVSNLSITPGDSCLELSWDPLPDGVVAVISRASITEGEKQIHTTRDSTYIDSGLRNGELYTYSVQLVCDSRGEQHTTNGVIISGSPKPVIGSTYDGKDVKIKSITGANGKIYIRLDNPPDNIWGYEVAYRRDRFPTEDEKNCTRMTIPMGSYLHHKALVIEPLEPRDYYFSISAITERDGRKVYSVSTERLFSNDPGVEIFYSISVTGGLFTKKTVKMTFHSVNKAFYLPVIDICYDIGHLPMNRENSALLYRVESQKAMGKVKTTKEITGLGHNIYVKPFVAERNLVDRYHLRPIMGTEHRIT
ncbi:MAG: hypothetical protein FWC73_12020 [Defluviitaleaceae bacterium]|nr:hypothetical protein [Defluviitaleaceae bacterium]